MFFKKYGIVNKNWRGYMRINSVTNINCKGKCSIGADVFDNLRVRRLACENKGVNISEFGPEMNGYSDDDFMLCSSYYMQKLYVCANQIGDMTPKRCDTYLTLDKVDDDFQMQLKYKTKDGDCLIFSHKEKDLDNITDTFAQNASTKFMSDIQEEKIPKNNVGIFEYLFRLFD